MEPDGDAGKLYRGTEEYLATAKTVDPELKKAAETWVRQMMPLLSEASQTGQGLSTEALEGAEPWERGFREGG